MQQFFLLSKATLNTQGKIVEWATKITQSKKFQATGTV